MLVKGFQTTCAACHAGQIEGEGRATAKGLAVFNVPGLDVAALAEKGAAIGGWTEFPDGEITAFMDFLLAHEDGYLDAWERLAELDLLDLSEASDAEVSAVERFAWSVKGFYFDLATRGTVALRERFEATLGRKLATGEVARLAGLLPADAIQASRRAWFPDLLTEVPRHRNGEAVPMAAPAAEAEEDTPAADQDEPDGADQDDESILDDEDDEAILDDEDDAKEDTPGAATEDDGILGEDDDDDQAEDENGKEMRKTPTRRHRWQVGKTGRRPAAGTATTTHCATGRRRTRTPSSTPGSMPRDNQWRAMAPGPPIKFTTALWPPILRAVRQVP